MAVWLAQRRIPVSRDPPAPSVHGLTKCMNRTTQSRGLGSASASSSYRVSLEVISVSQSISMRAMLIGSTSDVSLMTRVRISLFSLFPIDCSQTAENAISKQYDSRKDCLSVEYEHPFKTIEPSQRPPFWNRVRGGLKWKYLFVSDLKGCWFFVKPFRSTRSKPQRRSAIVPDLKRCPKFLDIEVQELQARSTIVVIWCFHATRVARDVQKCSCVCVLS